MGEVEPITVPELARKAQQELAARCNAPLDGPAVQVKFADTGKPVRRLAVISGAGGSLFEEALAMGADCLLTGEANHHHALDAKRLGLSHRGDQPLCHRIPGDRRRGRKAARRLPGGGSAGEHSKPGPVYVFIRRKPLSLATARQLLPFRHLRATSPGRGVFPIRGALGKEISFSLKRIGLPKPLLS